MSLETFAHSGSHLLQMWEHNILKQQVSLEKELSGGCEATVRATA